MISVFTVDLYSLTMMPSSQMILGLCDLSVNVQTVTLDIWCIYVEMTEEPISTIPLLYAANQCSSNPVAKKHWNVISVDNSNEALLCKIECKV